MDSFPPRGSERRRIPRATPRRLWGIPSSPDIPNHRALLVLDPTPPSRRDRLRRRREGRQRPRGHGPNRERQRREVRVPRARSAGPVLPVSIPFAPADRRGAPKNRRRTPGHAPRTMRREGVPLPRAALLRRPAAARPRRRRTGPLQRARRRAVPRRSSCLSCLRAERVQNSSVHAGVAPTPKVAYSQAYSIIENAAITPAIPCYHKNIHN